MAEHVQHPRRLVVGQIGTEDPVLVVLVRNVDGAGAEVLVAHQVAQVARGSGIRFGPERFAVGGEALVEPDVVKVPAGHHVSPPLVTQLVGDHVLEEDAEAGAGLVLHAAAPVEFGLAVLLGQERVGAEPGREGRDHVLDLGVDVGGRGGILRVYEKPDLHGIGGCGVVPIRIDCIGIAGHRHQVGRDRIALLPVRPGRGAVVARLQEIAVGGGDHPARNRDAHVHGVGLVGGVVLARPPGPRPEGLAQAPDQGSAVGAVEGEAAAGRQAVV